MDRSQRRHWGALAALLGATLAVAGCQDGYPIAATRCDRWCDVRQATECGNYNPASCVVECEQVSSDPACQGRFDELLACLERPGLKIVCDIANYKSVPECRAEELSLGNCAMAHASIGPRAAQ